MKNKTSVLLLMGCMAAIKIQSKEFTDFDIKGESSRLGGLIKCLEYGSSEQEENEEFVDRFSIKNNLLLLMNNNLTIERSLPSGSNYRICSRNIELLQNFIAQNKQAEQDRYRSIGYKMRLQDIVLLPYGDDQQEPKAAVFNDNGDVIAENKGRSLIPSKGVMALSLPCMVLAINIKDKNVGNFELGYRATKMVEAKEGAEYRGEHFDMKLTVLTEEKYAGAEIDIASFYAKRESK